MKTTLDAAVQSWDLLSTVSSAEVAPSSEVEMAVSVKK
jgi:hypothetical protein